MNFTVGVNTLSKTLMSIQMFSDILCIKMKKKTIFVTFQTLFKKYFCYNRKTIKFKAMFGKATKKILELGKPFLLQEYGTE